MDKKIMKLKNGTTMITHDLQHVHAVTIGLYFKVGSIYEEEKNNGITHLVEHLFFRRLNDLTQEHLYYKMQCLGAEIVGSTYPDYVRFEITVIPKYFIQAVELMSKFLNDFEWGQEDINAEKKVVIKQIENKYESFSEWYNKFYTMDTKYALPIMGDIQSVNSLTRKQINAWKHEYFNCSNACVIICGNYSKQDRSLAESIFSSISNIGKSHSPILELPSDFNRRKVEENFCCVDGSDEVNSNVIVFFDVNQKNQYESVQLLNSILGEGCGSKLAIAMRENRAITDEVYSELLNYISFSRIAIDFTVSNVELIASLKLLFSELDAIKDSITEKDYFSSIVFFTDDQVMELDNTRTLASNYAYCDFILKDVHSSNPIERKKVFEQITIDDLKKVAKEIFVPNNLSILIETQMDSQELIDYLCNINF